MKIYRVTDSEFKNYGRILNLNTKQIIKTAEKMCFPSQGSVYKAGVEEFESLPIMKTIQNECFGQIPIQLGYCYGHNTKLNALEWHICSEINIAVTDLILLLGDIRDICDNRYDSKNVKAFKVLKGEAIEVYSTTLHFCPVEAKKSGFGCVVGLVKGTNTALDCNANDKLLFSKNKWLMAHEDNEALIARGAIGGIYGENYEILGE